MVETHATGGHNPFRTTVNILIATVTVVGAVISWRISVAGGKADGADSQGLMAALYSTNTAISTATYLGNNMSFVLRYRQHLDAAELLEKQNQSTANPERKRVLRDAVRQERNLAATVRAYIDPDYLEYNPTENREIFDGNRYWFTHIESERSLKPLDEKPFFDVADQMRKKSWRLVGINLGLSAALFLYVAANTLRRRWRYYLAGAASVLFILSCFLAVIIEFRH